MEDQNLVFYKAVGVRIREMRIQQGLSQAELAEKAQLSVPVISAVENARTNIWLVTFAKIAEALQVSADDLLRLDTPRSQLDYSKDLAQELEGCTAAEKESILKIIRQLKTTFQGIRNDYIN